jgi:hypothetical protein
MMSGYLIGHTEMSVNEKRDEQEEQVKKDARKRVFCFSASFCS